MVTKFKVKTNLIETLELSMWTFPEGCLEIECPPFKKLNIICESNDENAIREYFQRFGHQVHSIEEIKPPSRPMFEILPTEIMYESETYNIESLIERLNQALYNGYTLVKIAEIPFGHGTQTALIAMKLEDKSKKTELHIRWMIHRDMPEVLGIETSSFEFPWIEDDFIRCLRQRNNIGMIIEYAEEQIVGFMIYELHKNRLHILNFAVRPNFRRQGVGSKMINELSKKLSHQRRNKISVEIRETNLGAQHFFHNSGFKAVSILRNFYDDTDEDAHLMQYEHKEIK